MRSYRNLVRRLFQEHQASPAEAELRLAAAYQRTFMGSPTNEDQELVLVDLADFSGFYRVTAPQSGSDQVFFNEGLRALYGRIFRYLRMSDAERQALETAARETAAARQALVENSMEG